MEATMPRGGQTETLLSHDEQVAQIGAKIEQEFLETGLYPLPEPIKKFNWGAFFMAPLWGAMHGQWMMLLVYPMWVVLDNIIRQAVYTPNPLLIVGVFVMGIGTIAFTIWYAFACQKPAYWRVHNKYTPEEYAAREKKIAIVFALLAIVFVVLATYYNLAIYPTKL